MPPPPVRGCVLIPPMLTAVALVDPSEFWLLFWLVLPEVPTAACPLVFPVFWTAFRTVVGLSASAGQTMRSMVTTVAADSKRFIQIRSPSQLQTGDSPGGEPEAHRQDQGHYTPTAIAR